MVVALGIAAIAVLAANVWATVLLTRTDDLEASQKATQLALVWLVPAVGAAVVISMRREFTRSYRKRIAPPESADDHAIDLALSVRRGARRQDDDPDPE